MTDTHAHIYSDKYGAEIDEILAECRLKGIDRIFMPNIDQSSILPMLSLEERYPGYCFAMMGLHPCSVDESFENELKIVEEWLFRREFIAVGEMGIDLYWDKTWYEQQQEAFIIQAEWAKKLQKPLVIHTRNAMPETIDMMEKVASPSLTGVVHCFTGGPEDARRIIDMNFHIGIGGVITHKNSGLDRVLEAVGIDKVVLETDSPYLAPVPYRGKRNRPDYLSFICDQVATFTGYSSSEVERLTDQNALRLFKIPA